MYAKYVTTSTSSQAEILSDVVAILTGTITVGSLSASCNQSLTEILTTYNVSGWEMYDNDAGTNVKVLRSACYDTSSQHKYMVVNANTAGFVAFTFCESWNTTTNTGVNFGTSLNQSLRISTTQSTTIHLFANASMFLGYSVYGVTAGNTNGYAAFMFEYTRWSPWDTATAGYPNWISGPTGYGSMAAIHRYKNQSNVDVTTSGATAGPALYGSSYPSKILNAIGQVTAPLVPLITGSPTVGWFGGNITERTGVYGTAALGTNPIGDEIVISGTTYMFTNGIATPGIYLLIPKG